MPPAGPPSRSPAVSTAILVAAALALAGCSLRQQNEVISSSPDGITIAYDTRYPTMAGVEADEHCAEYGKLAKRVDTENASSVERVTHPHAALGVFECVDAK